jgi:PAS domain S-box-containing protein
VKLYGYSEAEFLELTIMDIRPADEIEETYKLLKNAPTSGNHFFQHVHHTKKSGEMIDVEIYSTAIHLNNKPCRSIIAIDVTEKYQYERKIIKAIIKTQEDERYEIGGELHDNVCQLLAASQLSLGMLKKSLTLPDLPKFDQCKENISMALEEIRNLSHRLAPVFFADTSMEEAVTRLIESLNVYKNYEVAIYIDPALTTDLVSPDIQLNLYRIIQEQIRNIIKYAKGSTIAVDILIHKNNIKMKIADDGIGFNHATVKKGIGLGNMQRRAQLFSGKFEIISAPGEGCVVIIEIPISTSAVEGETKRHMV